MNARLPTPGAGKRRRSRDKRRFEYSDSLLGPRILYLLDSQVINNYQKPERQTHAVVAGSAIARHAKAGREIAKYFQENIWNRQKIPSKFPLNP
jgi:hypothetical protein